MKHIVNQLQVEDQLEFFSRVTGFRSQGTANSTLSLVVGDAGRQIFTGTTAGQIVKTPDATTLLVGREFEIINASTMPITLQDNGGNVLAYISQGRVCKVMVLTVGTANGTWYVDNNFYGANSSFTLTAGPATNNSTTVYVTAVTVTTENLPLGDYLVDFESSWNSNTNNRSADFRLTDNAGQVSLETMGQGPFITGAFINYSGRIKLTGVSGARTLVLEFKVGAAGAATITVQGTSIRISRVA